MVKVIFIILVRVIKKEWIHESCFKLLVQSKNLENVNEVTFSVCVRWKEEKSGEREDGLSSMEERTPHSIFVSIMNTGV